MFLLDTNHLSRILENDPIVLAHLSANSQHTMATSVITEGELTFMAHGSNEKNINIVRITSLLSGIRIHHIDSKTAKIYGSIKADLFNRYGPKEKAKRRHTTISQLGFSDNDLWIAALSLQHNLVVVSRDSDFTCIKEVRKLECVNLIDC